MYDLMVNQPVPFAVYGAFDDYDSKITFGDTKFICVTPNNTQPGSRVPESRTPWKTSDETSDKTSDVGARWRPARGLNIVVAGVVGLMLTL